MICVLHLAPHPDDEVLGAGATLMGLRVHGHRVINLACSLGRPDQHERRRREVEEACDRLGLELIVHDPPLAISANDDLFAARTAGVHWWSWGLWRDLARPTIYVPFGDRRLAGLQHALAAHRGELARNDFAELLRARAIASRVLGAERVFGFGSPRASEEPYAELLSDDGRGRILDLEHPLG